MPTTKPRYTVTDTGDVEAMLDAAQHRWPAVRDRRQLLLLLARTGSAAVAAEASDARRERQLDALRRAETLVDADVLLSDAAWR
jgi:hypothetical protein